MKLFIDTADLDEIARYSFILDGVTTNPTLVAEAKAGRNMADHIRRIAQVVDGPISVEAVGDKAADIAEEARELASIAPGVVVKIPVSEEGLRATRILAGEGVKTNVTLVFSANQALLAAKAGATYASIFVGRLDDIGHDGLSVVAETLEIYDRFSFGTEVITASIRHPLHVVGAARLGSHAATVPPKILGLMFRHQLTDAGVKRFLEDWHRSRSV
jgi:transaldolase